MSNSGNYLLRMMENGTFYSVCKRQPIWSTESSYTDAEGSYLGNDGHLVI